MKTRKINYEDYEKFSGQSDLTLEEGVDLFQQMNWQQDGSFYTLEFPKSFLQFFVLKDSLTVEIMLNEDEMLVATKIVSIEEGLKLIEYYYNNDEVFIDETYQKDYI